MNQTIMQHVLFEQGQTGGAFPSFPFIQVSGETARWDTDQDLRTKSLLFQICYLTQYVKCIIFSKCQINGFVMLCMTVWIFCVLSFDLRPLSQITMHFFLCDCLKLVLIIIIIINFMIINWLTELFSGRTDVTCKTTAQADIVLLVDGSWSIGRLNFKTIRAFIRRMVGVFDIGPDRVQIGKRKWSWIHS